MLYAFLLNSRESALPEHMTEEDREAF